MSIACHVPNHIPTLYQSSKVRVQANRGWSTSSQTWCSHSLSTCVSSQTVKVTVDSGLCLISYPQILDLAYPPPDNEIRNHLDWQARNLHEAKTRYLHLLGHLFRVA